MQCSFCPIWVWPKIIEAQSYSTYSRSSRARNRGISQVIVSSVMEDLPAFHFGFDEKVESVARKHYRDFLDVETYVKGREVCMNSKTTKYKAHRKLRSIVHISLDRYMYGFWGRIPWIYKNDNSPNSITPLSTVVDGLTKMAQYELFWANVTEERPAEATIDVVVRHILLSTSMSPT